MRGMTVAGSRDAVGCGAASPEDEVSHVVIEVSLPDRPGALGAVASRIGAVGGDITDVLVASRSEGMVDDVFHVQLPVGADGIDMVGLVLSEISQVDGVSAPSVSFRDGDCCT
jgi:ACT domain-containing protein